MRGMILNNNTANQGPTTQPRPRLEGRGSGQRPARRPNQAQRRQQSQQNNDMMHHQGPIFPNQYPIPGQRVAYMDLPQTSGRSQYNRPVQAPNQQYARPPAFNRQLYNPSSNGAPAQQHQRTNVQPRFANLQSQIDYLDLMARDEVDNARISLEEFSEKEALRQRLQEICRSAIFDYEKGKGNADIGINTIQLKCFGSLSTTFATKSSDMDLTLVSPLSHPSPSAPESDLPRLIEKVLLEKGFGVRLLTNARVPIIRFCEKPRRGLVALLVEARNKFDLEKETPPEPSPPKELPHKRKPKSKTKATGELGDNTTEKQSVVVPVEGTPEVVDAELDDTRTHDEAISTPATQAEVNQGTEDSHQESPKAPETEADDPTLVSKYSDAERIRLYRLAMREAWYDPPERVLITNFIRAVEMPHPSEEEQSRTRDALKGLPNILGRYRPPPQAHPLEFPKTGVGIQCDISFGHLLAVHNSQLLRCYSLCDTRVRDMVLFVKAWAKKRKINTPYHGTLSSYGYVLMVLHYLVNIIRPSVLPNLQHHPAAFQDEVSTATVELEGCNVRFLRNEDKIEALRNSKSLVSPLNMESPGSLLRGFFHYYAQQDRNSPSGGFEWNMQVLSLRTIGGTITKSSKGWTGAKTEKIPLNAAAPEGTQQHTKSVHQRYLLAIEDPFEIEHNVARTVVHNGIVAIRDEFRRAKRLIEQAGIVKGSKEDLFAEAEDRENLQYRAFGPRFNRPSRNNRGAMEANGGKAEEAPAIEALKKSAVVANHDQK